MFVSFRLRSLRAVIAFLPDRCTNQHIDVTPAFRFLLDQFTWMDTNDQLVIQAGTDPFQFSALDYLRPPESTHRRCLEHKQISFDI